jgi:LEA14-like dessication related protein
MLAWKLMEYGDIQDRRSKFLQNWSLYMVEKMMKGYRKLSPTNRSRYGYGSSAAILFLFLSFCFSCVPKEKIVLRHIKDVVLDASDEPQLRAEAVFYNPNNMRMRLRKIEVVVFINGKKAAEIDQRLKTRIPAQGEFSVPLVVKLATKELGLLDTLLGVLGGKKIDVHYVGSLKVNYNAVPIRVPVDYKDEVRIRF